MKLILKSFATLVNDKHAPSMVARRIGVEVSSENMIYLIHDEGHPLRGVPSSS